MTEALTAIGLFLLFLGASLLGMFLRALLPQPHRSQETTEAVRLAITLMATFSSLVLGLLTYSVKGSFEAADNDVRGFSISLIELDRTLRAYGPETAGMQAELQDYVAGAIASTWPDEPPPPGNAYPRVHDTHGMESPTLGAILERIGAQARELTPESAIQRNVASDLHSNIQRVIDRRWKLIEEAHESISRPFFLVLVFWLLVLFLSFGLSAPRSMLVYVTITLSAVSIGSAIYVILDMDTPFGGFITLDSTPLRLALDHIRR